MDPERWKQVEAILQSAMNLAPEELEPYLRETCKGDAELEGEIRHFLSVDRRAGSFLQGRAISQAPWAFDSNASPTRLAEGGAGSMVKDFQIVEKLGTGGMGVVYKAQDRRLGRFVALKFLGRKFAGDPAALSRFQREAQAASALNHPNICTLYDIGEHDGGAFLVMEYVAGKTLEALIPRSGLRLQQLLPIAIQVAEGISTAHSVGIIHRDLKPSNIMVTDNGVVKVLDFGLAKLTERPSGGTSQAAGQEDTQTLADQTAAGVVMGTAAYMSPEQVEARPVDVRSDVFSFGAMLYEMATGRRAFPGDSAAAAMSAVLNQEPKPLADLAPGLPPEFERLVTRCLRKDPRNRQQHMSDVKVLLEELKQESESGKSVSPAPRRRIKARAAAAAFLLSAAGAGLWFWPRPQPPPRVVALTTFAGSENHPSFSPDGNQVAFSWDGEKQDNWDIYVKMVGSASALRLTTGAADDLYPSWSPDGKQIAFLKYAAKTGIYLISALGGPEQKIVDFDAAPGLPVWSPDGKFLIAAQAHRENKPEPGAGALVLIPVESGEPRVILIPGVGRLYQYPAISPDGRSLAFASCQGVSTARVCDVSTVSLNAGLLPQGSPRHVTAARAFISGLAWAADGRSLIYSARTSGAREDGYLWRVGVRGGEPVRMEIAGQGASFPAAAAKRRERLVYARSMGDEDIWRLQTGGGVRPFLVSTALDSNAQFSLDGQRIVFASARGGAVALWLANADGSGLLQLTRGPETRHGSPRWSPDGRRIAFDALNEQGRWNIKIVEANGGQPRQLTTGPFNNHVPNWSHDGKWIYFTSDRTGRPEIWREPAAGGTAGQVTRDGGYVAVESPDGALLYYTKIGVYEGVPLYARPLAGGEERKVLERVMARGFALFRDGIYYLDSTGPLTSEIRFYDFGKGRSRTVGAIDGQLGLGLSVSPDRKTFLFSRIFTGSDLMMIENFQ